MYQSSGQWSSKQMWLKYPVQSNINMLTNWPLLRWTVAKQIDITCPCSLHIQTHCNIYLCRAPFSLSHFDHHWFNCRQTVTDPANDKWCYLNWYKFPKIILTLLFSLYQMWKLTVTKLIIQSPALEFQHYPVTTKIGYIYQKYNYLTNAVKGSMLQSAILGCVLQKH